MKSRTTTKAGLLAALIALAGCSSSDASLAAQGAVDARAPVQADVRITVDAPPDAVWRTLTAIADWPRWQPDITRVTIAEPPAAGVRFAWHSGSGTIDSRIALFEPGRRIAWTGSLYMFHAIHEWTLTPAGRGRTLVETRESMSGWPIGMLFSSGDLRDSDTAWLRALKRRAESAGGAPRSRG